MNDKIPIRTAIFAILFSVLTISGTSFLGFLYYQQQSELKRRDDHYRIASLIQIGPNKEPLSCVYLSELLDLSIDKPKNIFDFSAIEGENKLLLCPVIKEAKIKKLRPGTLLIDYSMRAPIAFWADWKNTALDEEGVPFPFKPFFTPKKLPEIYTGDTLHDFSEKIQFALSSLKWLQANLEHSIKLLRIDVSNLHSTSYGKRQIILWLEDVAERQSDHPQSVYFIKYILRLSSREYSQQMANFVVLRKYIHEHTSDKILENRTFVIDLRVCDLAFFYELTL